MVPKYKHGKQKDLLDFEIFKANVEKADLDLDAKAYGWLLFYTGVRKSEAYERVAEDVVINEAIFIIDFHQRKKGGEIVPPLKFPLSWPGVDLLVSVCEKARKRRPVRKRIFYQEKTGLFKKGKDGKEWPIKKKVSKIVKAHWLFPRIGERWAITIIKRILGENFYPHYLRLNRLSEIGTDPTANIVRLKSFSGIKSVKALESYLGVSEKEQGKALDFMATKIKPENKSDTNVK